MFFEYKLLIYIYILGMDTIENFSFNGYMGTIHRESLTSDFWCYGMWFQELGGEREKNLQSGEYIYERIN